MTSDPMSASEGPMVCPFLAFGEDRDRRSDIPDSRHHCYAAPSPTPIALGHQERYCLSSSFPACPVFRGWAESTAAASVGGGMPSGRPSGIGSTVAGAGTAAGMAGLGAAGAAAGATPAEATPVNEGRDRGYDADAGRGQGAAGGLGAAGAGAGAAGFGAASGGYDPSRAAPAADARYARPIDADPGAAHAASGPDIGSGRPEGTPTVVTAPVAPARRATMFEEVPLRDYSGGSRRGPGILLAIAGLLLVGVVAFLAAVLLGGPNRPNQVGAASPTAGRTAAATSPDAAETTPGTETDSPTPSEAPSSPPPAASATPTQSAVPGASGQVYEVRPGDSLCVIARRFGVTAAAILAANPQVTNPDRINAGDELIIPAKGTTPETTPSTSVPPC